MNNNSFKYSPWIKALCFVLSVISFALFTFNAIYAVRPLAYFSIDELVSDEGKTFYDSQTANTVFYDELCNLSLLCRKTPEEYAKELKKGKDKQVEAILMQYVDKKAEIIREELVSAVNEYNDGYSVENFLAGGITDNYVNAIPDTPQEKQKYPVNPYAPAEIRAAQKILNYAEGEELLRYAELIHDDAFYDGFNAEIDDNHLYFDINFAHSKEQAKEVINEKVNQDINDRVYNYRISYTEAQSKSANLVNIKYYIKTGDKVITNMKDKDSEIKAAAEHSLLCTISDGVITYERFPNWYSRDVNSFLNDYFKDCDELTVYMLNEFEFSDSDVVTKRCEAFNEANYDIKPYAAKAAAFLVLSIAALIVMLNLSGHKRGKEGITLAFIDKLPGDIHFILSAGLIVAGVVGIVFLLNELDHEDGMKYFNDIAKPFVALPTVLWMLLIELIANIVRTAKSEKSYFGSFFIVKFIKFLFNLIKKIFSKIGRGIKKSSLRYRPKHFRWVLFLVAAVLTVVNPLLVIFFSIAANDYAVGFAAAIITALVGAAGTFFFAKYVKNLDRVVEASGRRESVDFDGKKVHQSLEILNDSLKISNDELAAAVDKAVKNERTKTELITNVSHDLKTPLTSIISYVDLLKADDVEDANKEKYIGVIDEKANNLKVLIENLIEASKVSAGNVKLNKVNLNLKELVIQCIVENSPEFESGNLDLRFDEKCAPVTVYADSQQTYRIIENLVSNAKKYSAPFTRVYCSVKDDNGFGVFEIKNMSKEPLNISPDELTERFVRGDASRGEVEGNGLGLSIAKELCILQGGRLDIAIDGDLFKATVYLPV